MSDEKPPEKSTTQLPAVTDRMVLDELTKVVREGFQSVDQRLDQMETNLDLQGGSVKDISLRMTRVEERVQRTEDRQNSNSMRARGASEVDMKHDAAIAGLVADMAAVKTQVESIETKTDAQTEILTDLRKLAKNPLVVGFFTALITAATAWLAARGHP